jgi:hypothetical protein
MPPDVPTGDDRYAPGQGRGLPSWHNVHDDNVTPRRPDGNAVGFA